MLGAVTAFQRGEHMRMTAFVGMVSPGKRAFFDVLAIAAPLAFLALVLQPAYEFASDEAFVSTPALDISSLWRAAALPVGLGLMLLVALLRLAVVRRLEADRKRGGRHRSRRRGALFARTGSCPAWQPQSSDLLRSAGRDHGVRSRADRVCLWARDLRLHHADDQHAVDRGDWAHG